MSGKESGSQPLVERLRADGMHKDEVSALAEQMQSRVRCP